METRISLKAMNDIAEGESQVIIQVTADALKTVVEEMYRKVEERAKAECEQLREKATITRKDACEILGVAPSTLWRWNKEGYLKPVRIGAKVLYKRSDIDRLLSNKEEKGGEL